jgi:hypothetical protein
MTIPQYPGTRDAVPDHPNANLLATPSAVSPGSSIEAPPDYPSNPAQAPSQSEDVGKGIPQTPAFVSMGIDLMEPCYVCGRAYPPAPSGTLPSLGEHLQSHNESPFFDEGSDFGSDDWRNNND